MGSTDLPQRGQTPVRRVSASSIGLTRPGTAGELVAGEGMGAGAGASELVTGMLAVR